MKRFFILAPIALTALMSLAGCEVGYREDYYTRDHRWHDRDWDRDHARREEIHAGYREHEWHEDHHDWR